MHLNNIHTEQLSIKDWHILPGQCWAVIGRNGSGKQLLANLIAGKTELQQGNLSHDFTNIEILSFEAQQSLYENELKLDDTDFMDRLDQGTSVRELLGLKAGIPENLAFLGLDRILERGYRLLSSGEGRKTLLAHAVLQQPDFLILDEPYDSLDLQSRDEMQAFFQHLSAENQTQLLFLLNNLDEISDWHTHVAIMEKGRESFPRARVKLYWPIPQFTPLLSFDPDCLPDWPEDLPRKPPDNPLVKLTEGKVQYGDTLIFDGIDLTVTQGAHTLLTGANGSGKSTLLSLITGDHSSVLWQRPACAWLPARIRGKYLGSEKADRHCDAGSAPKSPGSPARRCISP